MPGAAQSDVAILGAGPAALALARELASRGVHVAVVGKPPRPGPGIVRQGLHVPFRVARAIFGDGRARDLWRLTIENRALAPGLNACGSYVLTAEPEGAFEFGERWLPRAELPPTIDRARFVGAIFTPGDGVIDPTPAPPTYDCAEAEITVVAEPGRVSFTDDVLFPMRRAWRRTTPIPPGAIPAPIFANFGRDVLRQRPDGRVIASGPDDGIVPMLRAAAFEDRWETTLDLSCDELPCIGPIPGTARTHLFCGWHGNELNLAFIAARMEADLITTGTSALPFRMFDPRRHAL